MLRSLILTLPLLTALSAADVQLFQWKNVNIQGMGYVTGLVAQPEVPFDVYIRTDVGGVYRFDRDAASWIPVFDGIATQAGIGCESVAIDPSNPLRAYAVINRTQSQSAGQYHFAAEVMVTEDRGVTWRGTGLVASNLYQGANDDYRVESGERLAVNPANNAIVYFATRRNGLWRGVRDAYAQYSWAAVGGGLPAWTIDPSTDAAGYTFVIFDAAGQTVYTGVHRSGVWRSTDGGTTWQAIGGPANPLRGTVASDGTLYVSFGVNSPSSGQVGRYQNGQWTDITPGDPGSPYTGITSDPTNPATVMVGRASQVWRSTNAGTSWTAQTMLMQGNDPLAPGTNPSAPPYYISTAGASGGMAALVIDPANSKQVWWTNGWGVARTDDITASTPFWAWRVQNLEELVAVAVRVPPKPASAGGADLISMVEDAIGFRHASRDQVPATKISPAGVPVDPAPSLSWQSSMFHSSTYPVPWPNVSMGSSLDYCYTQPDYLAFVGNGEWQAWPAYGFSSDNGATWSAFSALPSEPLWSGGTQQTATPIGGQIAMSATNPRNVIWAPTWGTFNGDSNTASGANAPWPHYTTDGGKTWNLCKLANPPAKPSPYNPQNNDDTHYDALPRSWANLIDPYVTSVILAADRADPAGKTFYYFDGWIFYRTVDGGATWTASAAGGFPAYIVGVTIASNPLQYGEIWLTFARNGCCGSADINGNPLYHSTDGGSTFSTLPTVDIADRIGLGMGKDATTPFLYILGRAAGERRDAIYKSEDKGQTWLRITNPDVNAMMDAMFLEGDMRQPNLLYVARAGRGVMYGTLPASPPPQPAFQAQGVVNAASFTTSAVRGSVATIFGSNLAPAQAPAVSVPLPRSLAGVMVTANDQPVPLWYVSGGQINFQMPWEVPESGTVAIRVYNGLAASDAVSVPVQPAEPGIFEYQSTAGQIEPVITHADYSLVTSDKPASSGEEIVIWMTGFGDVTSTPATGFPSPVGVLVAGKPSVSVGSAAAELNYAGFTAGAIGLVQVQATLPVSLPTGNPLPLRVSIGDSGSQIVDLWVKQ